MPLSLTGPDDDGLFGLQFVAGQATPDPSDALQPYLGEDEKAIVAAFNQMKAILETLLGGGVNAQVVHTAKGIVTANVADLDQFLTNSINNDGVSYTPGEGQIVVLMAQTTASENGPYVVGEMTGPFRAALARPSWWASGSAIISGSMISIGANGATYGGSVYQGCTLKSFAPAGGVVDTDDPQLFPDEIHGQVTLTNGGAVLSVPVRSNTQTIVAVDRLSAVGTALTVQYNGSAIVAGNLGTGSITIAAEIAAGTINVADGSVINWSVSNW